MSKLIDSMKKQLINFDINKRKDANLFILKYDLDRAKSIYEESNAIKEYNFRILCFECQNGLKESLRLMRKYVK